MTCTSQPYLTCMAYVDWDMETSEYNKLNQLIGLNETGSYLILITSVLYGERVPGNILLA